MVVVGQLENSRKNIYKKKGTRELGLCQEPAGAKAEHGSFTLHKFKPWVNGERQGSRALQTGGHAVVLLVLVVTITTTTATAGMSQVC